MHSHVKQAIRAQREFQRLVTGRRVRRRALPRQRHPPAVELGFYKAIRDRILLPAKSLVDGRLLPHLRDIATQARLARGHRDAGPEDVNDIMDGVELSMDGTIKSAGLDGMARKYGVATAVWQKEQLGKQLQAAMGVEVPIQDQQLGPLIQQFTATNVGFIKSLSDRYLTGVRTTVLGDISAGKRWEEIADDVEHRFDVSESTAKLIARDQTGKFFGSLNQVRQQELGIERFVWRTVGDNRVRDEHDAIDGDIFTWEDGAPVEGFPGEPVNCRCTAEPYLQDVVGELEEAA